MLRSSGTMIGAVTGCWLLQLTGQEGRQKQSTMALPWGLGFGEKRTHKLSAAKRRPVQPCVDSTSEPRWAARAGCTVSTGAGPEGRHPLQGQSDRCPVAVGYGEPRGQSTSQGTAE